MWCSLLRSCSAEVALRMPSLLRAAGLDARAAAVVMRVVRNIVDTGRTITCTIHQPSVDIFEVLTLTPFTAALATCLSQVWPVKSQKQGSGYGAVCRVC